MRIGVQQIAIVFHRSLLEVIQDKKFNLNVQLHNLSKDEYGYVYCYLMLYRFIYGHSLSSYGTVYNVL